MGNCNLEARLDIPYKSGQKKHDSIYSKKRYYRHGHHALSRRNKNGCRKMIPCMTQTNWVARHQFTAIISSGRVIFLLSFCGGNINGSRMRATNTCSLIDLFLFAFHTMSTSWTRNDIGTMFLVVSVNLNSSSHHLKRFAEYSTFTLN